MSGASLERRDLAIDRERNRTPLARRLECRESHSRFYILPAMKEHRIAVIPGDGIGREVIPEGVRVLEAVCAKHGIRLNWTEFDWSCDYYMKHGKMRPDDAPEILRKFDAIFFGAVGDPKRVPDHISAW